MFDALVNGRIDREGLDLDVSYFDIEELNSRAIAGEAEFTKISCAIIPQISDNYIISNSGAALGRGNGPLFVRRKGDCSSIEKIAIPGVHTTANMLITKLFHEITDRQPMLFSKIAAAIENHEVDAGVLIHEGRFIYAERNLELIADLGVLWEERTSLPLPLGAIAIRKDVAEQIATKFQELLAKSIDFAFQNPSLSRSYIKEHAQELDDTVIDSHIALFVNDFSRDLGHDGRAAINALIK